MSELKLTSGNPFHMSLETPFEQVSVGIRRQILGFGDDLMICRVIFEQSAIGAEHAHHHSQATYVESGRFRITVDGAERELGSGDAFYVEPHISHGSVCLEAGVLIDTFSPMRADFLPDPGADT